jgi:hypothetical protein
MDDGPARAGDVLVSFPVAIESIGCYGFIVHRRRISWKSFYSLRLTPLETLGCSRRILQVESRLTFEIIDYAMGFVIRGSRVRTLAGAPKTYIFQAL